MNIRKRTGEVVPFQEEKILNAMKKAFSGQGQEIDDRALDEMLSVVLKRLPENSGLTVERVQDEVERVLMECGHYEVAKAYILYREKRAALRRVRADLAREVGDDALEDLLRQIQKDFEEEVYPFSALQLKFESFCKPAMTMEAKMEALTKAAVELTTVEAPKWEFIAARLLNHTFSKRNASRWTERGVKGLYEKLRYLTDKGLYGDYILARYSREEIDAAEGFLCPERDTLFTYSGLDLLLKRYVIQSRSREPLETPQEMFLGIALHLAMNEASDRMGWVRRFYDMLSRMEVTMATPTMSNARKPHHQLSSCFIDTVPDSLDGIYRSVDNFAKVSKFGGGMGLYFGKVRATGSAIRGFQGAAGGVIRWIRLVNDTAVAVDQLGMRQGAVAVYLDAWHKDLPEFLQLRTNNGDDRMKAHDVFPAVCYPDLFWKLAEKNLDAPWHLMCPHEILTVKGYALEDYWGEEWEKRYLDCVSDPRIEKRPADDAASGDTAAATVDIISSLNAAGFATNQTLTKLYQDYGKDYWGGSRPTINMTTQDWSLPEPTTAYYTDEIMSEAKSFSDTAVVVIARSGGENADLPGDMSAILKKTYDRSGEVQESVAHNYNYTRATFYNNSYDYDEFQPGDHYLQLSQSEKNLVDLVTANFENVIIVINANNTMELGWVNDYDNIGAVILAPGTGATGMTALGEILNGSVNPSGHTTDTYLYDLTQAPTWNHSGSTGNHWYTAKDLVKQLARLDNTFNGVVSFVDYVEGIYMGYKFYETAAEEGLIDYSATVQYPFGYGLSYHVRAGNHRPPAQWR